MQNNLKNPLSGLAYPNSDADLDSWTQNIQSEIARGRVLQVRKSLTPDRSNAIFNKSLKLAKGGNSEKRKSTKWNRRLRAVSPIRKNRMDASTSRDDSFMSYRSSRKDRPACSMRISELAAPTKRQCIASWRANSNVLPENMVNRLKERVTDQMPIVKVSDAVKCLKYDKHSSNSRDNVVISSVKRPSRKINKDAMHNKIHAENQALSQNFGAKIAQLLMKPINITLNSQLQNISNIVSEELYDVIKNNKTFKADKERNIKMIQETSEKVTIWIGQILEDSTEKLLEEEMKASNDRKILASGRLVTLIEIFMAKNTELEEQEGPVLDILDDIVDNVLHKCEKTASDNVTPEFLSVCSSENEKDDADRQLAKDGDLAKDEDTVENDIKKELNEVVDSIKNIDDTEMSSTKMGSTIEHDIKKQLHEVIDSLKNSDDSEISGDTIHSGIYQPDNEEKHNEPNIDVLYSKETPLLLPKEQNYDSQVIPVKESPNDTPDLNILNDKENNVALQNEENSTPLPSVGEVTGFPILQNVDNDDKLSVDDTDEIKIIDDDVENATDVNEEQTSNVSDAIEIITEGLSEEKNKKVSFSNENLDSMKENEQHNPINRENLQSEDKPQKNSISMYNLNRPHIDFAPPNDHLLSDADESWPGNQLVTKPSARVTRSITSMGRIVESDENLSVALEDDKKHSPENTNSFQALQEYQIAITNGKNPNSTLSPVTDKNDEQQQEEDMLKKRENLAKILNEIDKTTLREPDQQHGSKIQNGGTSFTVHTIELPIWTETVELNISLVEPEQNFSNECMQKEESVIKVEKDYLDDSQNNIGLEPNSSPPPFDPMLSKWQTSDKTDSLKKSDELKWDRSESVEHATKGNTHGRIYQKRTTFEEQRSKKFDYRVHTETAPAWIRRGQGEPSGSPCACSPTHYSGITMMKEREREILKWGRDLDFVLLKLDKWKSWLNYISKYITTLKQKAALSNVGNNSDAGKRKPAVTDKNATWSKLNQRAKGGVQMRRQGSTVKLKISPCPVTYCTSCGRTKSNRIKKHRLGVGSHSRNLSAEAKGRTLLKPSCLNQHPDST